jgi:uncharacterized protein YgbK (DUF1537 family)
MAMPGRKAEAMPRILVIADDLSGAVDCGMAFATSGLKAVVLLSPRTDRSAMAADVLAVDADSRRLPAREAADVNAWLVRHYRAEGQLLYKKIDSTLRGNVGAEVAAIIPGAGLAIVTPAFPDTGRVVRGGRVFVKGTPLEETEIWRRENLPGPADVVAILARAGVHAALAPLDLVRGDGGAFRRAVEALVAGGATAVVCDAETNDDLAAIARATLGLERKVFWVGSAGLARPLPGAAALRSGAAGREAAERVAGPMLVAVGSLAAVSREQARRLAGESAISALTIPPQALRQGPSHPEWQAVAAALDAALAEGTDVVLTMGMAASLDLAEGRRLCEALGRLVVPSAHRLGCLVATGGDTAHALLTAMGASGLRLARAIEPGVVLSTVAGGRALSVVTKAGAFGTPETLVHCRRALHEAGFGPAAEE